MMFLNGEELMKIALEEIEVAASDENIEDYDAMNRIRGIVGFVHRMRDKDKKEDMTF